MLQRQIVVKAFGTLDIENLERIKYAGTSFHSISWILISIIVTINRNVIVLQTYENNHCITTTKLLRRCI
jgi:hypothetical protein